MLVCAECGRENPADARFCSGCGARLDAAVEAPREERKIVSVLFADLVGFTARSEQLDPEDVRATLSPYYARLREELERHGGTVEKFIGDAVMALFGAPAAHEDDPERAVRAALAIRDWVREEEELQVRIAVNTGEALVSLGARSAEGEGMAAGDVVNTAARLQSAAPVNGILVGERTYRATRHAIDYRDAEPVQAKGKQEPLRVWEALQAHAAFGVDVPDDARTELVGRDRELDVLRGALARVRDEQAPQLVTLVGVPGIGKSRLLYELSAIVEADPELISWRQGRSLPYGEGVSLWALAEVVKAQAGILEGEGAEEAEAKLAEMVGELIADDADAEWVRRNLAALVGVGDAEAPQGNDRRSEAFAAWRRFLEALAEARPLVLVLEDLHWADDALLDFVDHLVDWASGVQLLVVATARPELLERRPNWGGGKPNATTLSLSPLSDDDAARLLGSLLDRPLLEAGEQTRILERVGGNPLYAEQYAQLLGEGSGGGELPLPESVQGIVGARLDALPADEKQLLQDAAVIGKVFWPSAVVALAAASDDRGAVFEIEERLHSLERKQFVRRERRSSVGGETQYAFLHLLLRDVAYAQIPRAARIDRHVAAARWLEGLGRPEDHAEMLAHHYLSALETARASGRDDGELAPEARAALADAGDRAASLSAYAAAARFYRDALALWPQEPSSERTDLLYRLANASFDADEAGRDEALELARDALLAEGDPARAGELEALLAQYWWLAVDRERCFEHLDRAHALVADAPPSRGKARVLSQVARFRALAGEEVESEAREALRLAEELHLDDIRAQVLITTGWSKGRHARDERRADVEEGLRIAIAAGLLPLQVRAYSSLASLAEGEGDLRESMRLAEAAEQVALRIGGAASIRWARGNIIAGLFELGEWDRLEREADAFLEQSAAEGAHYHDAPVTLARALLRLARGDEQGALADQAAALSQSRAIEDPQLVQPAVESSSYILAELGRDAEARELFDEALGWGALDFAADFLVWTADRYGRSAELATLLPDADLPRGRALRAVVEGRYADAASEFDSMGAVSSAALARLRAAERLHEDGRAAKAREQLAAALAFYRAVRATRYVRRGEVLLARSA